MTVVYVPDSLDSGCVRSWTGSKALATASAFAGQRQRETDRQTETETETETEREIETDRQTDRYRETDRERDRERGSERPSLLRERAGVDRKQGPRHCCRLRGSYLLFFVTTPSLELSDTKVYAP